MPPPWVENSNLLQKQWMDEKDTKKVLTQNDIKSKHLVTKLDKLEALNQNKPLTQIAYPMGDFRAPDKGKLRKMEILMGTSIPSVKKSEIINDDISSSSIPLSEKEIWENERLQLLKKGKEYAQVSKKLDGSAWVDEDGYATTKEVPAFREGFNSTLRVKPPQNSNLHNGLISLAERKAVMIDATENGSKSIDVPSTIHKNVKSSHTLKFKNVPQSGMESVHQMQEKREDKIFRLSTREDISELLGNFFIKAIENGVGKIGPEKQYSRLQMMFEKHKGEGEINIAKELGKLFISLGTTLPIAHSTIGEKETREASKKHDSISLNIGLKMMEFLGNNSGSGNKPRILQIEDSIRKEVAIAFGRAFLHVQSTAGLEYSNNFLKGTTKYDGNNKDRTLKGSIGKLTLQLLESVSSQNPNLSKIMNDPIRREVLAKEIGSVLMQLETPASRELLLDRSEKQAAELLNNVPKNEGTEFTQWPSSMKNTLKDSKLNKQSDILMKRHVIGGRDAPPPTVPRFVGGRA
jgi:hypothetical protein